VVSTLVAALLLEVACAGAGQPAGAGPDGLVPIGAGLHGPAGLVATTYASGLPNVSAMALDARHRLWVTTASYEDEGGDGLYMVDRPGARAVRVLANLETPLGLSWYGETLFVASGGHVDAYGGLVGARFTEQRTVVSWPAGVGELDNLVVAPDGSLLVGISAPCDHCKPSSPWSGSIASVRPDGSGLRVYASAIRAPFGLTFKPGSQDLFVTMNQRDDLGARTPGDWLAVVRQEQNWGFPDCYGQGGRACTGVPEPAAVLDKHAAAGGVAIVLGQLGPTLGASALVSEWALGKVQSVALVPASSPVQTVPRPFLTGLKQPLPLLTASDGAVLVGDWKTGTVYRVARS
jgi:glucose/arabinose dehydrogenase